MSGYNRPLAAVARRAELSSARVPRNPRCNWLPFDTGLQTGSEELQLWAVVMIGSWRWRTTSTGPVGSQLCLYRHVNDLLESVSLH